MQTQIEKKIHFKRVTQEIDIKVDVDVAVGVDVDVVFSC